VKRVAVIGSASGNGKTTFGRALAERLGVPFVEVDALNHGPNWTEATGDELRGKVEPIVATDAWVLDGAYMGKLGDLVVGSADTIVWLDQQVWVWLPRLVRRTLGRVIRREELWNGNRESFRMSFLSGDSVIYFALRNNWRRRREYPSRLARYNVVRLRTQDEIDRFLSDVYTGLYDDSGTSASDRDRSPNAGSSR
jgi:adenylate kinase family enzyme